MKSHCGGLDIRNIPISRDFRVRRTWRGLPAISVGLFKDMSYTVWLWVINYGDYDHGCLDQTFGQYLATWIIL